MIESNEKSLFVRLFEVLGKTLFIYIVLFSVLSLIGLYFTFIYADPSNFWIFIGREILKGVLITSIIAGLLRWFFNAQFVKELRLLEDLKESHMSKELAKLKTDVEKQTHQITEYAMSLDAMNKCGVTRIYSSRTEASEDIKNAIENALINCQNIKVVGISLNEFTRDENDIMHDAWSSIEDALREEGKLEKSSVKAMIIDPQSRGGFLRANAENTNDKKTRLDLDIQKAISDFMELQNEIENIGESSFEARLYRTSPIFYMVWTPDVAFIQQYYFRPKHKSDVKIPVSKFIPTAGEKVFKIHEELEFHFDWLWNNAAIPINEYKIENSIGIFNAVNKANIKNIIFDYTVSKNRIIHLINSSSKTLMLKAISLNSYFQYNELTSALYEACLRGVEVNILLIDPKCEQAKMRSFREYKIFEGDVKKDEFIADDELIRNQKLYKDTRNTLKTIKNLNRELEKEKSNKFLNVKLYDSAPEAFIILNEINLIIEQYHYGKLPGNKSRTILGGDIPLIEYEDNDNKLSPYKIYKDHFEFVYKYYSKTIDTKGDIEI